MPQKNENERSGIEKRLDAVIRLLVEINKRPDRQISEPEAARILKSVDLTPTEIARIFGKKSATQVAAYLYGKK